MSVLVSGSLAYDYIMNFPDSFKNHILPEQIHILNVCFMVNRLEKNWGGTGGNIAYTAKLLGGEPILVSAVGKDGADYLKHFRKNGIDTDHVLQDKKQFTASAYITTDDEDNQITAFYNGPLSLIPDLNKNLNNKTVNFAIISPNPKDVIIQHVNTCKSRGIKTIFDPGQQITAFTKEELQKTIGQSDIIIGNDYEIKLIQERTGWELEEILQEAKILITTLGERGSVIATANGQVIEIKPCKPKSVDDPTGAGDAWRAGLLVGLEKNWDLKICAQLGSVAASYAIETYGTQEHTFTKNEFSKRYLKTYQEKIKL